jgi:Transposase DDE domain group 1
MRVPGVPRWCGGHHPVGDTKSGPISLTFNPQLRVEFRGATVTSDAGLLLPRELDDQLGLDALIEHHLSDPRTGHNRQFPLRDLFRQSIYSPPGGLRGYQRRRAAGRGPAVSDAGLRRETSVALTSTLHWFETDVLTEERNYQGLARLNTALIQHAAAGSANQRVTLDIDSSESPVHGAQEQSAYNGHFESVCYHPLFVFNPEGDCLAAKLRPGNVHSADGWDEVLLPIVDRYRAQGQTVVVRADAAFALPALYEALERRGVRYAIRLPANDVLERRIEDLLIRPRGRPSHAPLVRYRSFEYQAASWSRPRRVIAKVEHHLGELFPRVGFIVTTLTGTNRAVVRFYNQRGTAEQWIKEGKEATHWTRLSCHRFRANEVRLLLGVIAYNLGNLLRRLVLPLAIQSWSLTSLQQRLFKTGGRLIRHARYFVLQLAEGYLTQRLFRQIVGRIERLAWHPT